MPKLKTRKGIAKRVRVTRNGKLIRGNAFKSHLMSSKSEKRKRGFRHAENVDATDRKAVRRALGV